MPRETIRIVEVGPRDGLQNEPSHPSTEVKLELIARLFAAGVRHVEVGSFVSPKWVPQMADTPAVLAAVAPPPGAELLALVPNEKGLEQALATRVDTVAVFVAASETFSQKNTNCTIAEGIARTAVVVRGAKAAGRRVRGYVSCITDCPYEGRTAPAAVVRVAEALAGMGCDEIALGDTIGTTRPSDVRVLLDALTPSVPVGRLALHGHDTFGMAAASVLAAVDRGVRVVDGSVAGLGGCPYAPGATGNAATEDLVFLLEGLGFDTGIDLAALVETGAWISQVLGRPDASRTGTAMAARRAR